MLARTVPESFERNKKTIILLFLAIICICPLFFLCGFSCIINSVNMQQGGADAETNGYCACGGACFSACRAESLERKNTDRQAAAGRQYGRSALFSGQCGTEEQFLPGESDAERALEVPSGIPGRRCKIRSGTRFRVGMVQGSCVVSRTDAAGIRTRSEQQYCVSAGSVEERRAERENPGSFFIRAACWI